MPTLKQELRELRVKHGYPGPPGPVGPPVRMIFRDKFSRALTECPESVDLKDCLDTKGRKANGDLLDLRVFQANLALQSVSFLRKRVHRERRQQCRPLQDRQCQDLEGLPVFRVLRGTRATEERLDFPAYPVLLVFL